MFKFEQNPDEKADYIVGDTWSLLTKSWKGYREARDLADSEKMRLYAKKIHRLQKKLGIEATVFEDL